MRDACWGEQPLGTRHLVALVRHLPADSAINRIAGGIIDDVRAALQAVPAYRPVPARRKASANDIRKFFAAA